MEEIIRMQNNLLLIRRTVGWTAEEFGEKIGVTRQTINNIESGRNKLTKTQYIAMRSVLDAEMAQAVCDKLGMELKIEDMEFDSIINAVTSGKADVGVAGMTVTEDRLKSVDFSDPYTTATQVIIVRKDAE